MLPRELLLHKCLQYFLKHGIANLSLRPLAEAVGTSARMLLHHFGSKEGLITAVMEQARARLQSFFKSLTTDQSNTESTQLMRAFLEADDEQEIPPLHASLVRSADSRAAKPEPVKRYLTETSKSWMELVQRALPKRERRAAMATLSTAVLDGLLLGAYRPATSAGLPTRSRFSSSWLAVRRGGEPAKEAELECSCFLFRCIPRVWRYPPAPARIETSYDSPRFDRLWDCPVRLRSIAPVYPLACWIARRALRFCRCAAIAFRLVCPQGNTNTQWFAPRSFRQKAGARL